MFVTYRRCAESSESICWSRAKNEYADACPVLVAVAAFQFLRATRSPCRLRRIIQHVRSTWSSCQMAQPNQASTGGNTQNWQRVRWSSFASQIALRELAKSGGFGGGVSTEPLARSRPASRLRVAPLLFQYPLDFQTRQHRLARRGSWSFVGAWWQWWRKSLL